MGEPLTKAVLTLLNLSCEEIAIREYLGRDFNTPVAVPWRCFVVGGDDHLAVGPMDYLQGITHAHISLGSMISEEKHAISALAVRYCEKFLEVKNFWRPFRLRDINNSTEAYEASPFVDSIKVRLLSPVSKSLEVQTDRNIAIGKAKSLGKTLRWLNVDHFPTKWVEMVRERFLLRMKSYLPRRGTSLFYQLLLPQGLGGLGIYLDSDLEEIGKRLLPPTEGVIRSILEGKPNEADIRILKGFPNNCSLRGYTIKDRVYEGLDDNVAQLAYDEIRNIAVGFDDIDLYKEPMSLTIRKLRKHGWFTLEDTYTTVLRGFLFAEILSGEAKANVYNTEPWKSRYATLWDRLYKGESSAPPLTPEQLKAAFRVSDRARVFNLGEVFTVDYHTPEGEHVYFSKSVLEELTENLPILSIGSDMVGLLV